MRTFSHLCPGKIAQQRRRCLSSEVNSDSVLLERDVDEKGAETGVRFVRLNNPTKLNALTEVRCHLHLFSALGLNRAVNYTACNEDFSL